MSARRNGRRRSGSAPAPSSASEPASPRGWGLDRHEEWADGDWMVRPVTGTSTPKRYRCPGCDQEIPAGTPHVVAWRAEDASASDRRHWHTACWRSRDRRQANVQRGRSAPRYGR